MWVNCPHYQIKNKNCIWILKATPKNTCHLIVLCFTQEAQTVMKCVDLYSDPHADAVTLQQGGKYSCSI